MQYLKAQGCSPHTVRSYDCDLRKLELDIARRTVPPEGTPSAEA